MDADKLSAAMVEGARKYFDAAVAPLVERIKELEARPAPADAVGIVSAIKNDSGVLVLTLSDGKALDTGIRDGEATYPDGEVLERMVAEEVAKLPPAENGKDADPEAVKAAVSEALSQIEIISRQDVEAIVQEAIKLIPPLEVPDADEIAATVSKAVKAAVAELPPPEPGKSVTVDDVRPVLEEMIGKAITALPVAKDGVGLAGGVIDRDGNLTLTLTDGKAVQLGRVVGRDGEPGKPGIDGVGFDDMTPEFDGERTLTLRFVKGDKVKEIPIVFPVPIDRGVYRPETNYVKGDFVSFGGSGFIAQRDTSDKPETSDAWRLSVKRGRDGKDAQTRSIPSGPVRVGPGKEK